jgi:hypothetical protein
VVVVAGYVFMAPLELVVLVGEETELLRLVQAVLLDQVQLQILAVAEAAAPGLMPQAAQAALALSLSAT